MPDNSSLLKWSGLCAIVFGLLNATGTIARVTGVGIPPVSDLQPQPLYVLSLYENPGVWTSLLVGWLAHIFLFPALYGMWRRLRTIDRGLAAVGLLFGLTGALSTLLAACIRFGAANLVGRQGGVNYIVIDNQIVLFHTLGTYLTTFGLPFTGLFYLLWGLGFRRGSRPERIVGSAFVLALGFILVAHVLRAFDLREPAGIIYLLQVLMVSAAFIMSGRLLRKTGGPEVPS
jgi:hypothetical protein